MSDLVKLRLGDVGRKGNRLASGGTATREEESHWRLDFQYWYEYANQMRNFDMTVFREAMR